MCGNNTTILMKWKRKNNTTLSEQFKNLIEKEEKIDTPNIQIDNHSHLDLVQAGISLISGGVKIVLCVQATSFSEILN